ncbi:gem-associated protein 8 [Boleophthalmus pectinirostris]|uniref:gem-associated protein 8 n=1 Tax=Boleophthalmus pectinirostris TaxID=150288 RepID=UPI00242E0CA7|nr:gem-associated protein 8 [Boleophthalmus pectinirostris]
MEDVSTVMSWFSSPVYSRYWQHYSQAMGWYQRHRRAYRKALEAAYGPHFYPQPYPSSQARYTDWDTGEGHSEDEDEVADEEEEESSSDSDIECDVSNMEISEELRQYFAETERHREELKRQQQMEEEQQEYVPADQDLHGSSYRSTVAPPTERPGERRAAEMKKLYGKDASKIMAMEAAMQLTFDRNCDLKQPKYWPVIPLKL